MCSGLGFACPTRNDENNWKRNPLNGGSEIEFDEKWMVNDKRYRMKLFRESQQRVLDWNFRWCFGEK